MKYKALLKISIVLGGLFLVFTNAYSYNNITTHPSLTKEMVDFYNLYYPGNKITDEFRDIMLQGSVLEDTEPRYVNHFYDPTTGKGWLMDNAGDYPEAFKSFMNKGVLPSDTEVLSAKEWPQNQEMQVKYERYGGNRTWQAAIYDYTRGDRKEAFKTLGYVLHLIEDMTVPDHTRQDTHTGFLGDEKSPYEAYTNQYGIGSINMAGKYYEANQRPITKDSLNDYFDYLAKYSNEHFFSEETFLNYSYPIIIEWRKNDNQKSIGYGKDENSYIIPIIERNDIEGFKTINNPLILSSYWEHLSKQAILGGAGVIDLFFREIKKVEQNPDAIVAKKEFEVPFIYDLMTGGSGFLIAGNISLWGELNKIVNVENAVNNIITTYGAAKDAVVSFGNTTYNTVISGANTVKVFVIDTGNTISGTLASQWNNLTGFFSQNNPVSQYLAGSIVPISSDNNTGNNQAAGTQTQTTQNEEASDTPPPVPTKPINTGRDEPALSDAPPTTIIATPVLITPIAQDPTADIEEPSGVGGSSEQGTPPESRETEENEPKNAQSPVNNQANRNNFIPTFYTPPPEPDNGMGNGNPPIDEASGDININDEEPAVPETVLATKDIEAPIPFIEIVSYKYSEKKITVNYGLEEPADDFLIFGIEYAIGSENNWTFIGEKIADFDAASPSGVFVFEADDYDAVYFRTQATDANNNTSEWKNISALQNEKPLIINEVAWMGSPESQYDEWVELYNTTNLPINLSEGWALKSKTGNLNINFSKTEENKLASGKFIAKPLSYYLAERKTESKESPTLENADWFGSFGNGLVNKEPGKSLDSLTLYNPQKQISDNVNDWYAGSNNSGNKKTMERVSWRSASNEPKNWRNYNGDTGYGTPKAVNSLDGLYIAKSDNILGDETWNATESPYFIYRTITVQKDASLLIEKGVVVKFATRNKNYDWLSNSFTGRLSVLGKITVLGESGADVIFTSFEDDSFKGDTNLDNDDSGPLPASYPALEINGLNAESEINWLNVRHAGYYAVGSGGSSYFPAVKISNASLSISNSEFIDFNVNGLEIADSTVSLSGNTFFATTSGKASTTRYTTGLHLLGQSAVQTKDNEFYGGDIGIYSESLNCGNIENNKFDGSVYPIEITKTIPFIKNNQFTNNKYNAIWLYNNISKSCDEVISDNNFIVEGTLTFSKTATITMGPAVVFKFSTKNDSNITARGTFNILAEKERPAVFTSLYDAEYGGDIYENTSGAIAKPGDWGQISFNNSSSSIKNAVIRYGAKFYTGWGYAPSGNLNLVSSTVSISDSIIEFSMNRGILANSSNLYLNNTIIRNNNYSGTGVRGIGLDALNSFVKIEDSFFNDNYLGIHSGAASIFEIDDPTKQNSTDTSSPPELLEIILTPIDNPEDPPESLPEIL